MNLFGYRMTAIYKRLGGLALTSIFWAVVLLSVKPLSAFTIGGVVKNKTNDAKVKQVNVIIISQDQANRDTVITNYKGEWTFVSDYSAIEEIATIPEKFKVSQNYPNPFNPSTNIEFSISSPGYVEVTVHNILGQQIDSRRQFLSPGYYQISWKSRGSAGVYFYTIRHDGQSKTRKMIQMDGGGQGGLMQFSGSQTPTPGFLGKYSHFPISIIYSKFGYVSDTLIVEISGGEFFETFFETIHSHATFIDLHNDVLEKMLDDTSYHLMPRHNYNHTDIPRLVEGGVDIQFFAVWISPSYGDYIVNPYQGALEAIRIFNREMTLYPDYIQQVRTLNEAIAINDDEKIAAVMAVEGGHVIENDIDKLISLYDDGMRYMTITWNNSTDWAVSAKDEYNENRIGGLSEFGRRVIQVMDSLGIIIDVSHTGIQTIEDIFEITTNPIIATHSGVRAIRDHYRNLYDNQIQAIAESDGVIGIVFYPPFLADYGTTVTVDHIIQHIDHIVSLVGIDYVALGADYDGIGTNTVFGLQDVSQFPDVTMALLEHGYSQMDVEKILGKNFMRVFREVCNK